MLIQIHILQNYAPSNLNRDQTGSPKDAIFGGYRRGRISSQCIKRNIRYSNAFKVEFEKGDLLAKRTKLLYEQIKGTLDTLKIEEDIAQSILNRIPEIGKKSEKKSDDDEEGDEKKPKDTGESKTKQLIFLAPGEATVIAGKLVELYQKLGGKDFSKLDISKLEDAIAHVTPRSVDIAMFGRMTTSKAFEDVQAAVQVAHALSTNVVTKEFDFYTAIDDLKPDSEPGADMIGDVEFNSSTYYKYINIHWEGLLKNLGGEESKEVAHRAVLALLEASALSQPTGKQNSFAAQNLPDFILVEISKKNIPVSYANAFLKPIYPKAEKTIVDNSVIALNEYSERIIKKFDIEVERAFTTTGNHMISNATEKDTLADLKAWLAEKIG